MGGVHEMLNRLKEDGRAAGNFLGLLHVLIGRRVERDDGAVVSAGLTWRELAALLKKVRWDKDAVRDLGLDPARLPPRDRERFWFTAIASAQVDSYAARAAGDRLARKLVSNGYVVGPAPAPRT